MRVAAARFKKAILVSLFALCLTMFGSAMLSSAEDEAPAASATAHVEYVASTQNIANPERGFYHYVETRASDPTPYGLAELRAFRTDENITLIYCITYLDSFVSKPISNAFLQHVRGNLRIVRDAGLQCILRFAYTDDWNDEEPPFGDATLDRILAHIGQLEPTLRDNADVIAVMQAGFIGVWGEWYYTDHFVDDPGDPSTISPAQHARRKQVLERLLDMFPDEKFVQVRYPHAKQAMFGRSTPLTADEAYSGTSYARTGYHNDCFLASATDEGTYREGQVAADENFLAAETQYLPMGGETCAPNPPRSLCPTALAELERFHWTFLNREYHPDVYDPWVEDGCIDEMKRRLGYRVVLQSGDFTEEAAGGAGVQVVVHLANEGFAAPISPRPVRLILQRVQSPPVRYVATLPLDVRRWEPDSTGVISFTVGLPLDVLPGEYDLRLALPDAAASLAGRAEYAIRFANQGTCDQGTLYEARGENRLHHTVHITAAPDDAEPWAGPLMFAPASQTLAQRIFLPFSRHRSTH